MRLVTSVDVAVSDTQTFQDLVLLFDRPEFIKKCLLIKTKLLANLGKSKTFVGEYLSGIHPLMTIEIIQEVENLREEYKYPKELENAILMAVARNKVIDIDVAGYIPPKVSDKFRKLLKDGYGHPILSLKAEKSIRQHREMYWLNKKGIGYRKMEAKYFPEHPFSTIQSAIKSYKENLSIPV